MLKRSKNGHQQIDKRFSLAETLRQSSTAKRPEKVYTQIPALKTKLCSRTDKLKHHLMWNIISTHPLISTHPHIHTFLHIHSFPHIHTFPLISTSHTFSTFPHIHSFPHIHISTSFDVDCLILMCVRTNSKQSRTKDGPFGY
jgi:hypothetical protein